MSNETPIPSLVAYAFPVPDKEGGGFRVVRLAALVVKLHADSSIDCHVFLDADTGAEAAPIRFLTKVPFDASRARAPSWSHLYGEAEAPSLEPVLSGQPAPRPAALPAAPVNPMASGAPLSIFGCLPPGYAPPMPAPEDGPNPPPIGGVAGHPAERPPPAVFGGRSNVGGGGRSMGSPVGAQVFRSAAGAMARGDIGENVVASLGPPIGGHNNKLPPRIFVKDKNGSREVTPPEQLARAAGPAASRGEMSVEDLLNSVPPTAQETQFLGQEETTTASGKRGVVIEDFGGSGGRPL